jgi:hypothetical protein
MPGDISSAVMKSLNAKYRGGGDDEHPHQTIAVCPHCHHHIASESRNGNSGMAASEASPDMYVVNICMTCTPAAAYEHYASYTPVRGTDGQGNAFRRCVHLGPAPN